MSDALSQWEQDDDKNTSQSQGQSSQQDESKQSSNQTQKSSSNQTTSHSSSNNNHSSISDSALDTILDEYSEDAKKTNLIMSRNLNIRRTYRSLLKIIIRNYLQRMN